MASFRWRPRRRAGHTELVSILIAAALSTTACAATAERQIHFYFVPEPSVLKIVEACNAEANGRYKIVYHELPRDGSGQREQAIRHLAGSAAELDVVGVDVTGVAELAEAGWIAEWTGENKAEAERGVLAAPLETTRWRGKMYAVTKNTNVQLLWYDDRVVSTAPATWNEMIAVAQLLRARGRPYRVLFTGARYEGLVVLFNTLVRSAGGHILSSDGASVVMDSGAVEALEVLKQVIAAGITHPSVAEHREDEVLQEFQHHNGAFELNWPFVYAAMRKEHPQDVEHLRWARYPSVVPGRPSTSTIGGYNLVVNARSTHKAEAFDVALCLRDARNQKLAALSDGLPPTIESVYTDPTPLDPTRPLDREINPDMATAYPMGDAILTALQTATVRPLTPSYQELSAVIAKTLSPPSGIDPPVTGERLRRELAQILR